MKKIVGYLVAMLFMTPFRTGDNAVITPRQAPVAVTYDNAVTVAMSYIDGNAVVFYDNPDTERAVDYFSMGFEYSGMRPIETATDSVRAEAEKAEHAARLRAAYKAGKSGTRKAL
jgi:hypothetical protein